jgi:Tol biopolymer transport system component
VANTVRGDINSLSVFVIVSLTSNPSQNLIAFEFSLSKQICVVHAETQIVQCLTTPPEEFNAEDRDPVWSPDGRKLAFNRHFFDGRRLDCSVFTVNADGSNLTTISGDTFRCVGRVRWSPDGHNVTFNTNTLTPEDFFDGIVVTDGASQTYLSTTFGCHSEAPWSPDGTTLAVFCGSHIELPGIYLFDPDGTNRRLVIGLPNSFVDNLRWSPSGDRLLFKRSVRSAYEPSGIGATELWVVDADGNNPILLYNSPIPGLNFQTAEWTPDGTKIAFDAPPTPDKGGDIFTINPDGTDLTNISNDPVYALTPSLSPDGSRIAFFSARELPGSGLFVMNSDGSMQTSLHVFGINPQWSPRTVE